MGELALFERKLTDALPMIEQAAAEHLDPARLVRTMLTTLQQGVNLQRCTPESVLLACLNAAYLGLEPTGFLGDAYLIPYGDTCNLQIGYKGLIKLMKRTGDIRRVEAHEVWDVDRFHYQYGTDPKIEHVPGDSSERDKMVASYAVAFFRDDETQFEVMTPDEIAAVRNVSRAANKSDSPWQTFPAMMWRKSAVHRLGNYIELSAEARVGFAYDDRATIGETISVTEVSPDSYGANEHARIATNVKTDDIREQLDAATKRANVKSEIAELVKSVGWSLDVVPHFCQTTHGDASTKIDTKTLTTEQFEEVKEKIENAIDLAREGEPVELTSNDDPSTGVTLPPIS